MPVTVIREDITKVRTDAVVCPAGHDLSSHGKAAEAVFRAAGPGLSEAVRGKYLDTADTFVTEAYQLPAKAVIHTVGPEFRDGHSGEDILLRQCYCNCMKAAFEKGFRSIAFPLISSGGFHFPKKEALVSAMEAVQSSPFFEEMDVTLAVYDRDSYEVSKALTGEVKNFILQGLEAETYSTGEEHRLRKENRCPEERICCSMAPSSGKAFPDDIKEALKIRDESFAEGLLRMISERGMKNSDCYNGANVSKAVFSNIVNKPGYRPAKQTVLALALSLKLDLEETEELLGKAGYALSRSIPLDLAVEYLIRKKMYNVIHANEILFDLDLPLLGTKSE